MSTTATAAAGALAGIRVLDLSRVLAGPLAAQILADLGAEVIKVERPVSGDDSRAWMPPFVADPAQATPNDSVYFWTCNRGKRSIAIDLGKSAGRDLVRRLAQHSDVLIENYKTGTLERYGLGYAELAALNPRLIYCSVTGFGQTGPLRDKPGYDTIIQAMGGLMSITGNPDDEPGGGPRKIGISVADEMTALYSTIAILAALNERHASGRGQAIDMALLDVAVAALTNVGNAYLATGKVPQRTGNRMGTVYPSDGFPCRDGELMLIVGNDRQFRSFCSALGIAHLADDPRFATSRNRSLNALELKPLIAAATATRTLAECQALLDAAEVPASAINDVAQVFAMPQVQQRQMVLDFEHPDGYAVKTIGNPIRLSRTPLRYDLPPPPLGAHGDAILEEVLGLSADEREALVRSGAVAR